MVKTEKWSFWCLWKQRMILTLNIAEQVGADEGEQQHRDRQGAVRQHLPHFGVQERTWKGAREEVSERGERNNKRNTITVDKTRTMAAILTLLKYLGPPFAYTIESSFEVDLITGSNQK